MYKIKEFLITGLICIVLLAVVMFVPKYLSQYLDQKGMNKKEYFTVQTVVYKNQWDSFTNMADAISEENNWKNNSVVTVMDDKEQVTNKKLTEAVNNELKEFDYCSHFNSDGFSEDQLLKRKLVMIYSEDADNPIAGTKFWVLTYKNTSSEIGIVLDQNFGKICAMTETFLNEEDNQSYTLPGYADLEMMASNDIEQYYSKILDDYNDWSFNYFNTKIVVNRSDKYDNDKVPKTENTRVLYSDFSYDNKCKYKFGIMMIDKMIQL